MQKSLDSYIDASEETGREDGLIEMEQTHYSRIDPHI